VQPFEEVVGVTRQRPQPGIADPSLIVPIGAEGGELRVADGFTRHRAEGDHDAQHIKRTERPDIVRRNERRKCQHKSARRLHFKEDQQVQLPSSAPPALEIGISRVVSACQRTAQDVRAEPQRPDRGERRDQQRTIGGLTFTERSECRRYSRDTHTKTPQRVDPPAVAAAHRDEPGEHHPQCKKCRDCW